MRRTTGLLCIPLAVATAIVLVGAGSGAIRQKEAAREDMQQRLDAFVPPPEAKVVDSVPGLEGPSGETLSPNFLDIGRVWVTPESVAQVRSWVEAHVPPNAGPIGTGYSGSRGDITWDYDYFLPELKGVARERQLEVSVTAHGAGSALRADAQAVWVEQRPTEEKIPPIARVLEIERTHEHGGREKATVRGARAIQLARLINGFGIIQPGTSSCTQPGQQAEIELTFHRHADTGALAEARFPWPMSNCDFLELKIGGKRRPGLEEAWILHRHLHPILARMAKRSATRRRGALDSARPISENGGLTRPAARFMDDLNPETRLPPREPNPDAAL
jgi:hypothetical protein